MIGRTFFYISVIICVCYLLSILTSALVKNEKISDALIVIGKMFASIGIITFAFSLWLLLFGGL